MKVKELIKELQKLPQEDVICAEVLGDDEFGDIPCVSNGCGQAEGYSFVVIDRTKEMKAAIYYTNEAREAYEAGVDTTNVGYPFNEVKDDE